MKYISQPPLLLNVHMHNPTVSVRSWMDSLLAFFPGLQVRLAAWLRSYLLPVCCACCQRSDFFTQVLRGDLKPAIETHEMLYQVTKQHKFLPEVKSRSGFVMKLKRCLNAVLPVLQRLLGCSWWKQSASLTLF